MRDYLVLGIIFASLPFCFMQPFVGGLVWTWVAFMNPHRLAWGFARNFPVAFLVGVATLAGFAVSAEPKRLPRNAGTYLLILLWLWVTVSTMFAFHPQPAFEEWSQSSKILLMLFVILALTTSLDRLRLLCLVTAGSIAVFGVKGGIFAIATGGQYRTYGPEGTFLGANNGLGLALDMVLPILFYLSREVSSQRVRLAMRAAFVLSILAVISSYSRGAVLGLTTVLLLLVLKSGRRLLALSLCVVAFLAAVTFVPAKWSQRMETIKTYQKDESAMGRINAWRLAWRLGLARPLFGWGPRIMEDKGLYDRFYPDSPTHSDVHSTYFQLLAGSGFPALGIFLSLLVWCLLRMQRLRTRFRDTAASCWVATYADMVQISICAFIVAGAFLEKAFFDLLYHVIGFAIILDQLAANEAAAGAAQAVHAPKDTPFQAIARRGPVPAAVGARRAARTRVALRSVRPARQGEH